MVENKEEELRKKEKELKHLISKYHTFNDAIYDISPHDPEFNEKVEEYRKKITEIWINIDLLKMKCIFLNIVLSSLIPILYICTHI